MPAPLDPCAINPGELRHRVQIQTPSTQGDAKGKSIAPSQWNVILTTHAKIEGTASRTFRESFSNNAPASLATDVITIRWPGRWVVIKTGMRVQFGDNYFQIQAVDNVLRLNRKVVLACVQVSSDSN